MAALGITPGPISQMVLYTTAFTGLERFPLIVPTTAQATAFQNYAITSAELALLLPFLPAPPVTILTSGATLGSPYAVTATDWQVLVNKTVGAATGILMPNSTSRTAPVFVKDLKGDGDTNNISVTFTAGQSCDGLTTYPITLPYGGQWFSPLAAGGWYISG